MKILLISDLHGNWPALQAVLAAEPEVDQILCLGDLVNYGPQPAECVRWAMGLRLAQMASKAPELKQAIDDLEQFQNRLRSQ